ncbi:Gfo/Idh/MocA family oxidoreductase [Pseudactinotalea suaedae]|uniref:Gfo/Idh/MocA family oxidoreductase n=1 Tax=Pseudactinotalea suaedae TaxID=1524924 RepID=UPI0012E2E531|nr:Gfo/Idh/MocA family oxidoreductase [Pseudactinotalea suaedae]
MSETPAPPSRGATGARRRYALIGASNRGVASFARPLIGAAGGVDGAHGYGASDDDFSAVGELVAVLDVDRARAEAFVATLVPEGYPPVAVYEPEALEEMLREMRPDAVIVASPDHTHGSYILAALEAGVDVISEKPMVATAAEAATVVAAEAASTATVHVTHNFRYPARHRRIKQMLAEGAIGRPLHVDLAYYVDTRHGASYFLRWNRERAASGGLTIHKSTHHLDLIAWWLGAEPTRVYAVGGRDYYGPRSPHRPAGVGTAAEVRERDPYHRAQLGSGTFPEATGRARTGLFDLPYEVQYPASREMTLYDDEIDIEDHVASLISYAGGATAAYAVQFSAPWEGYRLTITGTHGSIEAFVGRTPEQEQLPGSGELVLRPLFEAPRPIEVPVATGGHDGADPLMRRDLFVGPDEESTAMGLMADARQGALAVATGEAIWRSAQEGRAIEISELLR